MLYTCDVPQLAINTIATFAIDTTIKEVGNNHIEPTDKIETALHQMKRWRRKWKIELNVTKSEHIYYTNKTIHQIPMNIIDQRIPYAS